MKILSIALAIIHSISALVLLIFSGWFIAACAISGIDYAQINFNYLLPAVIIRTLALARIASGYSQMWTGHKAVLMRIKTLRTKLFDQLKNKILNHLSEGTEALAKHSESIASITMSWTIHNISAIFSTIAATLAVIIWLPEWTEAWIGFLLITIAILIASHYINHIDSRHIKIEMTQFRHKSEYHLSSASIWHLYHKIQHPDMHSTYKIILKQQRKNEYILWVIQSISLIFMLYILSTSQYKGQATALILILLFLSAKDWLAAMIRSQPSLNSYQQSINTFYHLPTTSIPSATTHIPVIEVLSLKNFNAANRPVQPINLTIKKGEIMILKGGSGSGKTSLLKAIAGLLPHQGEKTVNQIHLMNGFIENWHYSDQFPTVLSASLAVNLRLAQPNADDNKLRQALDFAHLNHLTDLSQWLGEQGRRLSGGELKRLNIARSFLFPAHLYLLDEPFEGLNTEQQQQLAEAIKTLSSRAPIIIASHIVPNSLAEYQCIELSHD